MSYKLLSLFGDAEENDKINIYKVPAQTLPCFVLDANVCLNIIRHCKNPASTPQHIKNSNISVVSKSNILSFDIIPDFGAFELCIDKNTFAFDNRKFKELLTIITQFIESAPEKLAQDSYVEKIKPHNIDLIYNDATESLKRLLKIIYASMLRIAYIAKRYGLKKDQSISNLKKYLKWADETLDIAIMSATLAGLAIFGGQTISRKAISLDSNNYDELIRSCWGCAWDFLYFYIMQYPDFVGLKSLENAAIKHFSVLVTEDTALHSILSHNETKCAFTMNEQIICTANIIDIGFPHYKKNIETANKVLDEFDNKRRIKSLRPIPPQHDDSIANIINDCESELIILLTN